MKKVILIILIVAGLAAVAMTVVRSRDKAEAKVEVGKVATKDLVAQVNCSGTIQPQRKVDVSANAMGTIVNLAVKEGQRVAEGDLLLEIDPTEYRASVQALRATLLAAESDLELARANLEKANQDKDRAEKLFAEGLNSQADLDAAQTSARIERARVESSLHRIDQYQANLQKAQHDLEKVTISAPMAGVITRLNVEEGENAIMGTLNNPGTVLLVISDLGTMEAWVDVDETEVVELRLGQIAKVTIDAFPDQEFAGTVTEIDHSPLRVSTGGGSEAVEFQVKITLGTSPENIRPGLTTKAEITVDERQKALTVPLGAVTVREWPLKSSDIRRYRGRRAKKQVQALKDLGFEPREAKGREPDPETEVKRKETEGVFVIQKGFVKFVPVKLGIVGQDDFEIIEGLQRDQKVVTGPFRILRELRDGAEVSVLKKGSFGDKERKRR